MFQRGNKNVGGIYIFELIERKIQTNHFNIQWHGNEVSQIRYMHIPYAKLNAQFIGINVIRWLNDSFVWDQLTKRKKKNNYWLVLLATNLTQDHDQNEINISLFDLILLFRIFDSKETNLWRKRKIFGISFFFQANHYRRSSMVRRNNF